MLLRPIAASRLTSGDVRRRARISATRFALAMIEKYDLTGKLCHYSVGEGLPLIREARRRGLAVTCEVTPHHLFFDDHGSPTKTAAGCR